MVMLQVGILQVGVILGGDFSGGKCPGGNFFCVRIVRVEVFLGGNFLWWRFSGWELSEGNHLGGSCPSIKNIASVKNIRIFCFKNVSNF